MQRLEPQTDPLTLFFSLGHFGAHADGTLVSPAPQGGSLFQFDGDQ